MVWCLPRGSVLECDIRRNRPPRAEDRAPRATTPRTFGPSRDGGNMRRSGQPPGPTLSPRADIPGASRVLEAADRFRQHVLGKPEHDVGEEDAERDNREEDRIERQ